ncbi:methylmalonyl Co-A mutase-associated GTPase MeaB [Metabacillus sediminilitoris]|uniref:Methylmalonyl Co-A mutase-associated GTPase MeaB n=1 Tax=Metabacillus sediminilitoris TaxID=2567941 RepID=A0A4S4BZ06_9BACI|nr:methylmalonyl Co-A mutase-associated GTPase MeaB [Metabacillus sediminilitoris]QGQ47146.1 methylmalonyl Co-A mutase-associated GTPase MeaB [Metabacillus sediminilitoris]THF80490.1 methylmalonyl Co-A mutase-associated GTPase MeaB [Metabacillus sediminilitoris]
MTKYFRKKNEIAVNDYIEGIVKGDRVILAQAITLVESNAKRHFEKGQQIIEALLQRENSSIRIGITGVPGAGKSTFIDAFGTYLCDNGYRIAVLAVDPSSEVSKGSIMGDKTRMERLAKNPRAFIRPSPSGGNLGGVNRKTRETIILCEAAGFDVILVETMGVGQGEFVVRNMVDFFILLVLTGAGDELQTMKKGIMELPDLVVVNKADGDNLSKAKKAMHEYNTLLHFLKPYTDGWTTKAVTASAIKDSGIENIWKLVYQFVEQTKLSQVFEKRRKDQQRDWLHQFLKQELYQSFYHHPIVREKLSHYENAIINGNKSVAASALELLDLFRNDKY